MCVSVYFRAMSRPALPLSSIAWTAGVAGLFGEAMAAIGRLDARISASPVAQPWRNRTVWKGYSTALQLQRYEIDEIDVFSQATGVPIAGRPSVATAGRPFDAFGEWKHSFDRATVRHWREGLPFSFDPPDTWSKAPPLIRALTLLDIWTRQDPSPRPWLCFPQLLASMNVVASALPCLVIGDLSLRTLHGPRERQLKRLLKALRSTAADGLKRLDRLEGWRLNFAAVLAEESRPGLLRDLGKLVLSQPLVTARLIADTFEITLSGAGKLLARAAAHRLLVEVSGRNSWRLYVTPDMGIALGMVSPPRGRPPSPPRRTEELDTVLADFDKEMEEIDTLLQNVQSSRPS